MPTLLERAKATFTGDDRLKKRTPVKALIADKEKIAQEVENLVERMRAMISSGDQATENHDKTTTPLQSILLDIEADVSNYILKGEDVPEKVVKRRSSTLDKIRAANDKLEAEMASINRYVYQLEKDIDVKRRAASGIDELRNKLKGPELGNPTLLKQLAAANQIASKKSQWHLEALNDLRESDLKLEDLRRRAEADETASYESAIAELEREAEILGMVFAQADEEKEQAVANKLSLRQQLVDE